MVVNSNATMRYNQIGIDRFHHTYNTTAPVPTHSTGSDEHGDDESHIRLKVVRIFVCFTEILFVLFKALHFLM